MKKYDKIFYVGLSLVFIFFSACTKETSVSHSVDEKIDPTTVLWYQQPADKWENAVPVGNGRLGAMVHGRTDIEEIQFNEDTHWSGGPYSTVVKGGYKHLPEIQNLIFAGDYIEAHKLFGRYLMGDPVEQQKFQATGRLWLKFESESEVENYKHVLDLTTAISKVEYVQDGIRYTREVFSSVVDQVIVVRLTADKSNSISFSSQLRGYRNRTHSNYSTDYFQMDGFGKDGLNLAGKSADYMGAEGRLRYLARLKAIPDGGTIEVKGFDLNINDADAVTIFIAAATNFKNYKDVSGDQNKKVEMTLAKLQGKTYDEIKKAHIEEQKKYFNRVSLDLGSTPNSFLPTDQRLQQFNGSNDPNLAALLFQFGRYLLICSSRPGTQPANLQGIWNNNMNPPWDSKYTTNINTEMNYWPAEVGNLSEFTEPLFTMIEELSDQGSQVAREHYGKKGWVFHQNTDIWRVAAPMDGVQWGTFTTGGAWLCTHLWEHYLYNGDVTHLKKVYPLLKGNVEFFLDFLVEHPKYGWLVTCPSTSPENYPDSPENVRFFDEVIGREYTMTICAGSTIDMQILKDLFGYVAEATEILGVDKELREKLLAIRKKLAPMQTGKNGDLQEWLKDWPQREGGHHRHISNLYGLYPGNQISVKSTPEWIEPAKVVLNERGLTGNGWASAWKMACWARLYDAQKAVDHLNYYVHNYCFNSLFAICSKKSQVDGSFGVSAAVAEMLIQSHEGEIHLLPTLPNSWDSGEVSGLCARGGFEVDMKWEMGKLTSAKILSKLGYRCRIRIVHPVEVYANGNKIEVISKEGFIEFSTEKNADYEIRAI